LIASRKLLIALARRDLLIRYKQAILGIGWAVFSPLLHMVIFTIVFTRVVPLETGLPYPVYAYAGLLPWTSAISSSPSSTFWSPAASSS
jgi:ABC-type polysaccharide/polyol phosphate export permease